MEHCKFNDPAIREIVRSELRLLLIEMISRETDQRIDTLLSDLRAEAHGRKFEAELLKPEFPPNEIEVSGLNFNWRPSWWPFGGGLK